MGLPPLCIFLPKFIYLYNYYKKYSNISCLTRSMAQVYVHGQVCNLVGKCNSCVCLATKFTIVFIPWVRKSSVSHCLSQKGLFVCLLVYIIIKPPELSHKPTFNHIKIYFNYISTLWYECNGEFSGQA